MGGYVKRCLGLQVKMRIENPVGKRIQEIYFNDSHLDKDKMYKAAFVTAQGVPEKWGSNRKDLKIKVVEAMEHYLKATGEFNSYLTNSFNLV
jgi:sulfur-oxidizing protein SoxB